MKKIIFYILFLLPFLGYSQTYWTGAVDTDWNTAGNWSAGVPNSSTAAVVASCSTCPILTSNVVTGGLTVEGGGNLNIGTYTVTVYGLYWMSWGNLTSNGGVIDANRTGNVQNSQFYGNLTLRINSAGTNNYLGGMGGNNTYHNDFTLEAHTGDWTTFEIGRGFVDTYKGKTIISNVGKGWLVVVDANNSYNSPTVFEDDVEFRNVHTDEGHLQICLNGGKIRCLKKARFFDNTNSFNSYIWLGNAQFDDETEVDTRKAHISLGGCLYKEDFILKNREGALVELSWSNFEEAADFVIPPSVPFLYGDLRMSYSSFYGSASTAPLNIQLGSTSSPTSYRPNTLVKLAYMWSINRELNLQADYIHYQNSTFHKATTMKRIGLTGTPPSGYIGGGVCPGFSRFEGTIKFHNEFGDHWVLGGYGPDVFKSDAEFIQGNNPWGALRASYSGSTTYEGNIRMSTHPASYNGIVWGENTGFSTLISGKTVSVDQFGYGLLTLSRFTQLGATTPQTINMGTGAVQFYESKFESPLQVTTSRIGIGKSTFFNASFTKTGSGADGCEGQNIFKKKVHIKNQSTGSIVFYNQNSKVNAP